MSHRIFANWSLFSEWHNSANIPHSLAVVFGSNFWKTCITVTFANNDNKRAPQCVIRFEKIPNLSTIFNEISVASEYKLQINYFLFQIFIFRTFFLYVLCRPVRQILLSAYCFTNIHKYKYREKETIAV